MNLFCKRGTVCLCTNLVINGDAIGPADADIDKNYSLRTIQTRSFNTRILTPLRPEQIPVHTNTWVWDHEIIHSFLMFIGTHSHLHLKYRHIPSPFLWMYTNGTRFVQTLRDDHIAEGAVESGHLNHIKALISPIDVAYLYKTTQCVRCTNI